MDGAASASYTLLNVLLCVGCIGWLQVQLSAAPTWHWQEHESCFRAKSMTCLQTQTTRGATSIGQHQATQLIRWRKTWACQQKQSGRQTRRTSRTSLASMDASSRYATSAVSKCRLPHIGAASHTYCADSWPPGDRCPSSMLEPAMNCLHVHTSHQACAPACWPTKHDPMLKNPDNPHCVLVCYLCTCTFSSLRDRTL